MSDLGHPLTRGWHELCIDLVAGEMITEHLIPDLTHFEKIIGIYMEILLIESYRNEIIGYPYTMIVGFQMKTNHTFNVI